MKRLYSNVSASQRSLKERPEIFHSVDVNLSTHVSLCLVNHVMHETPVHSVIVCNRVVRVDLASILHILEYFVLQSLAGHVRNNLGANLTQIPVKDSLHNRFSRCASCIPFLSRELDTARTVHVFNLATYEGFVRFHFATFAADLARIEGVLLHNFADALKHEPCRRLRDSQSTAKFVRTDSVLGIRKQPKCRHPLIKSERRILKDRLNFDCELPLARIA